MAYNEQKIFNELGKLTPNELYIAFGKIKEFVTQTLEQEKKQTEEKSNELATKIQQINGLIDY